MSSLACMGHGEGRGPADRRSPVRQSATNTGRAIGRASRGQVYRVRTLDGGRGQAPRRRGVPKHGRGVTSGRRRQASQGRDLCQVVIRAVFLGGRTLATP